MPEPIDDAAIERLAMALAALAESWWNMRETEAAEQRANTAA